MARILIIDDDASYAELTRRRLEKAGLEVTANTEPSSVIPLVASGKFDVVVLDLSMPGLSGENLLTVMRNLPALDAVRVIVHSSADETKMRAVAERYDAAWIPKSASSDELVGAVKAALSSKAADE